MPEPMTLLPCPFCGKSPGPLPGMNQDPALWTSCLDENCAGHFVWDNRTTHDCPVPVAMWNRRAPRLSQEAEEALTHWWPMLREIIEHPELLREPHCTAYERIEAASVLLSKES